MQIDRSSTEFAYVGLTGDVPDSAQVAFMTPPDARPTEQDWSTATLVTDDSHPLWADAVASGVTGDYYLARLVGPFGDNDLVLTEGEYQCWVRLVSTTERPVRIAPVAVEVR